MHKQRVITLSGGSRVKAPKFSYARPESVTEAVSLLADDSCDSRILAGGQSLMPALNFRLDAPDRLIDINRISELSGITVTAEGVRIGALTRHAEVERSPIIAEHLPLISEAIRQVAHTAIRNRGTFAGSLALADPAAELPACCLAYDADIIAMGNSGERRIPAAEFFLGLYETALAGDEIITAVEFASRNAPRHRFAFAEISRRHGDYAMAGLALSAELTNENTLKQPRVALFGVSDRVLRIQPVEEFLQGQEPNQTSADQAAELLDGYFEPAADLNASEPMKLHLSKVLLKRNISKLADPGRV